MTLFLLVSTLETLLPIFAPNKSCKADEQQFLQEAGMEVNVKYKAAFKASGIESSEESTKDAL